MDAGGMPALHRPEGAERAMRAVLGPSASSGSQAFPVSDDAHGQWYVKVLGNPQGAMVLVTEYLASRAGRLIGAPVCEVEPIEIPAEFDGYQVERGPVLSAGVASASRFIPHITEIRGTLAHRDQDDNARRHAGVMSFYDWFWGDDPQWLVSSVEDLRLYSHDHGFYLPPGGQTWTAEALASHVDTPRDLGQSTQGLDVLELARLEEALRDVTPTQIEHIIFSVPAVWPVTDDQLAAVRGYLVRRAPQVGDRLAAVRATLEAV